MDSKRVPTCKRLHCFTSISLRHSGPVISKQAKERIEGFVESAEKEGGKILLDGRGHSVNEYPNGHFVGPTIIEVNTTMSAYQ